MAIEHPVKLAVSLTPCINQIAPEVWVFVPGRLAHYTLYEPQRIEFEFESDQGFLEIKFINKDYNETTADKDMAVIIDQVEFFGISSPKFVWAGIYRPQYPEPWASQQKNLAPELPAHNYLGWNGTWRLDFDVPVFTWMHKIMNLGWIYD